MPYKKYHIVIDEWMGEHSIVSVKFPDTMTEKQICKSISKDHAPVLKVFQGDELQQAKEWAKTHRQNKMRDISGKVIRKSWREV